MLSTLLLITLSSVPGDAIVARVGDTTVTAAMVAQQRENLRATGRETSPSESLESCINDVVLANEARRLGLASDPRVAELVANQQRNAAVLLAERDFTPREPPSEAQLREMFQQVSDSCTYEQLAFEKAEAAQAARARIDKGGTFADEARTASYSRIFPDPQAAPVVLRSQVEPALAAALFAVPPRTVVGPVQVATGWSVARTLAVQRGTDAEFAARRQSLVERRGREVRQAAEKHVVEGVKKKSGVKVDEAFLRALDGAQATPSDLAHVIAKVGDRQLRYRDIYPQVQQGVQAFRHAAGPGYKVALAWSAVERMLLEDLAVERYGKSPELVGRAAEFERVALVQLAVDRHVSKLPAEKRPQALAAEIDKLRKASKITVDGAALAQALPAIP
jgi:hypothetical protein